MGTGRFTGLCLAAVVFRAANVMKPAAGRL